MNMKKRPHRIALMSAVAGFAAIAAAAVAPDAAIQPESRVWVEGGSTVRGYTCEAPAVGGSVTSDVASFDVGALAGAVRGAEIVVDASALDCGNGTMNSHMRNALKASDHPAIRFRLDTYTAQADGAGTRVQMQGALVIAGSEQPVTIDGVATPAADGGVRVAGSHAIRMTDYGVKPPSLMLGTMKVHDNVTLNFDVVLKP